MKNKKIYEAPDITVLSLESCDIITISKESDNDGNINPDW